MYQPQVQKYFPSPQLRDLVDFYLLVELPMTDLPYFYSPATYRNILSFRCEDDMTIEYKNAHSIPCQEISLTGSSDSVYYVKSTSSCLKLILVHFSAYGASSLFRINQSQFLNSSKDLEDIIPYSKRMDLKDRILVSSSDLEKISHIEEFLIQFLPGKMHSYQVAYIQEVLHLLHLKPEMNVRELAFQTKISEVHLRRLFNQHIGLSPKKYLALNRFNKVFLSVLRGQKLDRHPYHDDPHLIKEFKRFTGFTPTSYPSNLISTDHILESIKIRS
ncbi:MAG: AraC family transcriptional regulator [Bacteroidota bacterium]